MEPQPKTAAGDEALTEALDEPAPLGVDGPPPSIDELVALEDAAGLVELGAAYRAGTPHVERDAFKALECFEAASRLGDAEAEYLVGVAYFEGLGIAEDTAEGAKRLRSAAQRGSLRAKVFVANLYEMGVHYAHDAEKADVWYRNVARAAGLEADPESVDYEVAMAELGCVRHCLALVADESLPKKDRAFYLKKAKAMGYRRRLQEAKKEKTAALEPVAEASAGAAPSAADAAAAPEARAEAEPAGEPTQGAATPDEAEGAKETEAAGEPAQEREELGAQWTLGRGLLAFGVASFFAAAAAAAGWLAMEGSRALAEAGRPLPGVGARHWAVLGATLFALGVLPASAAYRPKVVGVGAVAGGLAAAGAFYLWDAQPLLWDRVVQTAAGGLVGFLVVVLFLGLLGGTRWRAQKKREEGAAARPTRRGA
jgi:hypothetical protein